MTGLRARYSKLIGTGKRRDAIALSVILAVLLALVLVSCAAEPSTVKPSVSSLIPPAQQVCPDGTSPPRSPKPPRSIPQIIDWGVGVFEAWYKTEMARQECARRLTRLNEWVQDHIAAVPVSR
jgi:hypothetical protein